MSFFTFDKNDILNDSSITWLLSSSMTPKRRFSIVKQAMESGKSVVTANK
jgi:homoserine dehydrogenase